MTVIQLPKNKLSRKITSIQGMAILAVCFILLIFVQGIMENLYDYDTTILESLRKEGYDIKVNNHVERASEPPIPNQKEENNAKSTEIAPTQEGEEKQSNQGDFDRGITHDSTWPSPVEVFGENAILQIKPILGEHRPEKDAVFSFAKGLTFKELIRFVGSLLGTGYDGDIVLAVEQTHEIPEETLQYLEYHSKNSNVIVYPAELVCKRVKIKKRCKVFKMYMHKEIGGYLPDPRPHRELAQLRFEYYWAWSTLYSPQARIFLLDSRDLMFQSNPFAQVPSNMEKKIMAFEESNLKQIADEPNNRLWLREGHQRKYVQKLGKQNPVCAGTIVGGQAAIETFGRAMVNQWDTTQCKAYGCDQGHVNFLVHGNFLVNSTGIEEVVVEKFGESFVMSLALQMKHGKNLRKSKFFQEGGDASNNIIVNQNGKPSAIVHQFDQDRKLKHIFDGEKTAPFVKDWERIKSKTSI